MTPSPEQPEHEESRRLGIKRKIERTDRSGFGDTSRRSVAVAVAWFDRAVILDALLSKVEQELENVRRERDDLKAAATDALAALFEAEQERDEAVESYERRTRQYEDKVDELRKAEQELEDTKARIRDTDPDEVGYA